MREGYSWPWDENEKPITKFSWPISGSLIPGAPILKTLENPAEDDTKITLRVCRNGNSDSLTALTITRLEVENLMKKLNEKEAKKEKKKLSIFQARHSHCIDIPYVTVQLNLFLDKCSAALELPNAARRLFTESGEELASLENLKPNQLVFVSLGEPYTPPKTVKEELEKKQLMANLTDDVNKLAYFNKIKFGIQNLVIEAHKASMSEDTQVVIGPSYLNNEQLERVKQGESLAVIFGLEEKKVEVTKEPKSR